MTTTEGTLTPQPEPIGSRLCLQRAGVGETSRADQMSAISGGNEHTCPETASHVHSYHRGRLELSFLS